MPVRIGPDSNPILLLDQNRALEPAADRPRPAPPAPALRRRGHGAVFRAMGDHDAARRTIAAIWKIESAKLIAGLARIVRDVGLAEELAQDALVAALERWPAAGVPERPGAWLMTTAKNRAIDLLRRRALHERKADELAREIADAQNLVSIADAALDDVIGDDLLRLIFTACHPVLPADARIALTLRLVGGLATDEIARAFLVPEATVAQRIVRAKRQLAEARVPFETPHGEELSARLASVLEVVYLIFNEGYAATEGSDWMRPALCEEALRLGRILAGLAPDEPEVHGLVALMEIQASRTPARTGPDGAPVLLLDQNRARWDRLLIGRGLAALERARALPGKPDPRDPGPYVLQGEIAACHARAVAAAETDWPRIAALYGALARLNPSPVIELNRAVAVAMADGPAAGLALADALCSSPALKNYHLLPSVRGDFLFKLGRHDEARAAFERAAGLTRNERERALLLGRAAACSPD
jgi:RNA polymerase sigma factor (sigma-70 family)